MALSILSTISAEVTIGPRVYYAMAKIARLQRGRQSDPRWHTPVNAIIRSLVRHADDADAPSRTGGVHRFSLTLFHRPLRGVDLYLRRRRAGWQRLRALDLHGR